MNHKVLRENQRIRKVSVPMYIKLNNSQSLKGFKNNQVNKAIVSLHNSQYHRDSPLTHNNHNKHKEYK